MSTLGTAGRYISKGHIPNWATKAEKNDATTAWDHQRLPGDVRKRLSYVKEHQGGCEGLVPCQTGPYLCAAWL